MTDFKIFTIKPTLVNLLFFWIAIYSVSRVRGNNITHILDYNADARLKVTSWITYYNCCLRQPSWRRERKIWARESKTRYVLLRHNVTECALVINTGEQWPSRALPVLLFSKLSNAFSLQEQWSPQIEIFNGNGCSGTKLLEECLNRLTKLCITYWDLPLNDNFYRINR